MSWYSFRPYVPVAERRRRAQRAAEKLSKKGRALLPVRLEHRAIATTFWGKAWCDNLESYSDYANRLPRGRTYVRNGSVVDLKIADGKVEALVQGSSLYKIAINMEKLPTRRWTEFTRRCAGQVTNLLDLLQGRLSQSILTETATPGSGLFPAPKEIRFACSCPDWADMCKHVAAVLYGVGSRLDTQPEMFFTLRGVDMNELLSAASAVATAPLPAPTAAESNLAGADLSEIFGVDLDASPALQHASSPPPPSPPGKPARASASPRARARRRRKPVQRRRPNRPARTAPLPQA